jgi:hypothetical protein
MANRVGCPSGARLHARIKTDERRREADRLATHSASFRHLRTPHCRQHGRAGEAELASRGGRPIRRGQRSKGPLEASLHLNPWTRTSNRC